MMSKKFARLVILVLCLALVFCGCAKSEEEATPSANENPSTAGTSSPSEPTTDGEDEPTDGNDNLNPSIPGEPSACSKITIKVGNDFNNILYIDEINGVFADELKINADGQLIEATIYGNNGQFALSLPAYLGDTVYGLDLNTLEQDLKDSTIWALTGMTYEQFQSQMGINFDEIFSGTTDFENPFELDTEELMEKLFANVAMKTSEGKVMINGNEVDAWTFTFSMDEEGIKAVGSALIDMMESSMSNMLEELRNSIGDQGEENGFVAGWDFETMKSQFEATMANADLECELNLNLNAITGELMSIYGEVSGTIDGEEDCMYLNVVFGEDPASSTQYTMESGSMANGQKTGTRVVIDRSLDQAVQVVTLRVSSFVGDYEQEMMSGSLQYDTATSKYQISTIMGGEETVVTGSFQMSDELFELSVDEVVASGETTVVDFLIRVETIDSSEIPEMPAYKNPLKLEMLELMELIQKLSSFQEKEESDFSNSVFEDSWAY